MKASATHMRPWVLLALGLSSAAALGQEHERGHPVDVLPFTGIGARPFVGVGTPNLFGKRPRLRTNVEGWSLTGSRPDAYQVRCDEVFTDCAIPILRTRSGTDEPFGMGSLTHFEPATKWRGMRVRLKGELKGSGIDGWAALWMRIDGADGQVLAFDNMQDRPLRGTSGFGWYSVVLDVPLEAERVSFGVLLHGPGAIFVRQLEFEAVDDSVAASDLLARVRAQTK